MTAAAAFSSMRRRCARTDARTDRHAAHRSGGRPDPGSRRTWPPQSTHNTGTGGGAGVGLRSRSRRRYALSRQPGEHKRASCSGMNVDGQPGQTRGAGCL